MAGRRLQASSPAAVSQTVETPTYRLAPNASPAGRECHQTAERQAPRQKAFRQQETDATAQPPDSGDPRTAASEQKYSILQHNAIPSIAI